MTLSYIRLFNALGSCIIAGLLGVGLKDTINTLNNTTTSGLYASYIITGLLVVLFNISIMDFSKKGKGK